MSPRVLFGAVLAACALLPASASASTTFGADLSLSANNTQTCATSFPFALGSTSCLSYSVNPTSYAPFSGVVNTVRVKTGDVAQGPMQVVVLRSYYQNNLASPGHPNFYCCFVQEYGPVFTPTRNAITTVPVTLGMVADPTPAASDGNTVAKGDFLGLSVLDGNVPIPLNVTNGGSGFASFYAPAPQSPDMTPAGLGGGQGSASGYTVLMNADIDPIDGATATPVTPAVPAPGTIPAVTTGPAPVAPAVAAPITFPAAGGRLLGTNATVPLICRLTTACTGRLTLQDGAPARAAAKKVKPKVLGKAHFSIAAGRQKAIKVKLNSTGRKLARHRKKLAVYAVSVIGSTTTTHKVTLKAAKK